MKVLLISPYYPDTFWSLRHAVRFSPAKASFPPLGLLTVAAMLPADWPKKLVDLNVESLTDSHLEWADVAFVSAMTIQSASADEVVLRCKQRGLRVVAGGPHYSRQLDHCEPPDHMVLGEAEEIIPELVRDLLRGEAKATYRADEFPDVTQSPPPLWEIVDFTQYADMSIQFTRGCPFTCDFCDVVLFSGHRPRLKTVAQIIAEMDALYQAGWRGEVMFVDDNFIGQPVKTKELLRAIVDWQRAHRYPFWFVTQASLNLAGDPELLSLMSQSDFKKVFIGIETTSLPSLDECGKLQNQGRDLIQAVHAIQQSGMEVLAGFIVGFDMDPPTVFDDQVQMIQEAGIPAAMIGLLSAPPGTPLWHRLEKEGRLLGLPSGDNAMDTNALNFVPKMGRENLVAGYRSMAERLYQPQAYFDRVLTFFANYRPNGHPAIRLSVADQIKSAFKILWVMGVKDSSRRAFWRFIGTVLRKHRHLFTETIIAATFGYHFCKIAHRFLGTKQDEFETVFPRVPVSAVSGCCSTK